MLELLIIPGALLLMSFPGKSEISHSLTLKECKPGSPSNEFVMKLGDGFLAMAW